MWNWTCGHEIAHVGMLQIRPFRAHIPPYLFFPLSPLSFKHLVLHAFQLLPRRLCSCPRLAQLHLDQREFFGAYPCDSDRASSQISRMCPDMV